MKLPTGPVVLFLAGVALMAVHWLGRRRRRETSPAEMRAAVRFLLDLIAGAGKLAVFAGWMFAPRHVMPGQRIPRPKARRMVETIDPDTARKMTR